MVGGKRERGERDPEVRRNRKSEVKKKMRKQRETKRKEQKNIVKGKFVPQINIGNFLIDVRR